jgi:hypothetical protein
MARRIDPYDDEYEGIEPEPFVGLPPAVPVPTYSPGMTYEIGAPGGGRGLPLGRSVLDMRPSTYIGEGGGVGGKGGGRADDPGAFDDFGRNDPYGGGLKYRPPAPAFVPQEIPTTAPTLAGPAPMAARTGMQAPRPATTPRAAPAPRTQPGQVGGGFTQTPSGFAPTPSAFNLGQLGDPFEQFSPAVSNYMRQFDPALQAGALMEPEPDVTAQLRNTLLAGGAIPPDMGAFRAGLAGQPTGGEAPTQDLLSQYVENTISTGANIPVQNTLAGQLQEVIKGAGISPDYVRAARETILEPSMDALYGSLNKQGKGMVDPQSGLQQEIVRRAERDFMNNLIMAGQEKLPQYMDIASRLGTEQARQRETAAAVAAGREGRYGDVSLAGLGQGIDYLNNVSQLRLGQQDQMGAIIRGILSGALPRLNTGVLAALISGGFGFAGSQGLQSLLNIFGIGKKDEVKDAEAPEQGEKDIPWGDILSQTIGRIPMPSIEDILKLPGPPGPQGPPVGTAEAPPRNTGIIPGLEEGLQKQLPEIFRFPGYEPGAVGTPGIIPFF